MFFNQKGNARVIILVGVCSYVVKCIACPSVLQQKYSSSILDGVPYDGVPTKKLVSIHPSLTVIFSILATCGIVFAVVCLFLNIHFRNKRWEWSASTHKQCVNSSAYVHAG